MKYEILKRKIDIERQFKEQLALPTAEKNRTNSKSEFTLAFDAHNQRSVQCKLCLNFYLESQNHSISCEYHSDVFGLFCPRSCPSPGLSAMCSAHRIRRWKCCDSTKADAIGCCRRYHVPVDSDPVYEKILEKVSKREIANANQVDELLQVSRRANWVSQLQSVRFNQLTKAEDAVSLDRSKIAKYGNDPLLI